MRIRLLILLTLLLLTQVAQAGLFGNRVDLVYSLVPEDGSAPTSFARELVVGEGFRLSLRSTREGYVYVLVREGDHLLLLLPQTRGTKEHRLEKRRTFVWPRDGWLRLDERPGAERLYLVFAPRRLRDLEGAEDAAAVLSDSLLLDLRDRYHTDSHYSRDVSPRRVVVRHSSRDGVMPVLIEEIVLRHR